MKADQVFLRTEITRQDALSMTEWLMKPHITQYLNEGQHVVDTINQVVDRVHMPILTHLFNRNGCFFMICLGEREPIGFLRIERHQHHAEIVVVVGKEDKWGRGFGTHAIQKGLAHVFFTWRMEKVIAKIHDCNLRSIHAFQRAGFVLEKQISSMGCYAITQQAYLKHLMAAAQKIG